MIRWFFALVVVLAGTTWWVLGSTPDEPEQASAAVASEAVVALARPAPAPDVAAAAEELAQAEELAAFPDARETAPVLERTDRRAETESLLARATQLSQSGQVDEARNLLTAAMGSAQGDWEAGRLALGLSQHAPDPASRRQMLGHALSSHAVQGDEWDLVSQELRQLAHDPRASLHGLLELLPYTVRPGDSLWKLCNRTLPKERDLAVETGLIRLINGMSSDMVHPGQTLLVPREPLRLEVDRTQHGLVAWLGPVPVAAYRIGLGKENRTPSGSFLIEDRQENPDWYFQGRRIPFGDPRNVLGTRWLGFQDGPGVVGYGIHGTSAPESVGGDESMGCIRMRNADVEELFELVPRGTEVSIP